MTIGIVPSPWWQPACEALDISHVAIPPAQPANPLEPSDIIQARIKAGDLTRALAGDHSITAILDGNAAGLTFHQGANGLENLTLTHEGLGIPLVSYCTEPISVALNWMAWPTTCTLLTSPSWTLVFTDATYVSELARFGLAQPHFLPAAAPQHAYDTAPIESDDHNVDIAYLGDACVVTLEQAQTPGAPPRRRPPVRQQPDPSTTFFERYHSIEHRGEPPTATEDRDTRAQKAAEYFRAKQLYQMQLATSMQEQFIVPIATNMGARIRLSGSGWQETYQLESVARPTNLSAYMQQFRSAAINVCGVDGLAGASLSLHHFEITAAGGFLLCLDQPAVAECFRIGVECDTFSDERELEDKIAFYLAHPQKRNEIAQAGQRRALENHLLHHRLMSMLGILRRDGVQIDKRQVESPHETHDQADPHGCPDAGGAVFPAGPATLPATAAPPAKLLVLLNPGRVTRNCLIDMATAAATIGLSTVTYEIGNVWATPQNQRDAHARHIATMLDNERVTAVLSYTYNGLFDWPAPPRSDGRPQSLFESVGIPHLLWWTDHPQWASKKAALRVDLQPLLASSNCHHFVKSEAAARELREVLRWPNCYELPVAESAARLSPATGVEADYDVVAIVGGPPQLDPRLEPFLEQDDPDENAILSILAQDVREHLRKIVTDHAPQHIAAALRGLCDAWLSARCRQPKTASVRVLDQIAVDHAAAVEWLFAQPRVYFDIIERLWDLGRWQRSFVLAYLARHFKVGVFGADWSSIGLSGSQWVDSDQQAAVYARGRIAINISQGSEEEGISHKPFQIAASGVPMLHIDRMGLSDCFQPGREVAIFNTAREAKEAVAMLLANEQQRQDMADRARKRLCDEHTWGHRVARMLQLSGVAQAMAPQAGPAHRPAPTPTPGMEHADRT